MNLKDPLFVYINIVIWEQYNLKEFQNRVNQMNFIRIIIYTYDSMYVLCKATATESGKQQIIFNCLS